MMIGKGCAVGLVCLSLFSGSLTVWADVLVFAGAGTSEPDTTGDLFEGVANEWVTVDVVEISGLKMTARTTTVGQTLNANSGEFGINSDIEGETADLFDVGETMQFFFDQDVQLEVFDMSGFTAVDRVVVKVGDMSYTIENGDLSNGTYDTYSFTSPVDVSAGTTIEFFADAGAVGLDSIQLQVIPEPAVVTLIGGVGLVLFLTRRFR